MATRTTWQDRYGVEQTASLTAKPTFAATAIGIEGTGAAGGKFLMPLTAHPHLKPSSALNNTEMATGLAQRHNLEYNTTIAEPSSVTISMLANAYNVSLFTWLLLQSGCSEAGSTVLTMTGIPYTDADCEIYAAVTRILGGTAGNADTVSQYMPGCICRSLTLSGETGGLIQLTAELVGADWANANDDLGSVSWSALTFSDKAPLKFQNMRLMMDNYFVSTPSFSITFNNNAVAQFYNNGTIQKYVLGRLTAEGSLGIPWGDTYEGENAQITAFKNGTQQVVTAYWGDASGATENSLSMHMNIVSTDTEMADAEGELLTNINFAAVEGTSDEAILIKIGYTAASLDRGVA